MSLLSIFLLIVIAFLGVALLVLWVKSSKQDKKQTHHIETLTTQIAALLPLKKYNAIKDAEAEAYNILEDAKQVGIIEEEDARRQTKAQGKIAREKATALINQAEDRLKSAYAAADKIKRDAHLAADKIASEALKEKSMASLYTNTAKAMKNRLKGYGDEYLIPSTSILDDLADDFSYKDAGITCRKCIAAIKSMVKHQQAASCEYAESKRKDTAIAFVLDAFNGKVDSIMAKIKYDNYGKLRQQIIDAFHLVNLHGQAFRNAKITDEYLHACLEQLKWAVAVLELKREEQEEQRIIKQQIRDEERARREYEKAIKDAAKEERMLQQAMEKARKQLAEASDAQRAKYEGQLSELMERVKDAEERGKRAISMAQQTKRGHVYVISNIGSFGENIFKIGMTRRLEPLDRVKELGDASVPFPFDVHAMIFSDNAPGLEHDLHQRFRDQQVNKVNPRKEFFGVPLTDIKALIDGLGVECRWTMTAEAMQYRESMNLAALKKNAEDLEAEMVYG